MFTFRKRKKFCEGREPLPNAEFLGLIGIKTGEKARYALAIRKVMGRLCKVPPEMIRESDGMKALCDLMFDGWDQLGLVLELECELDQTLGRQEAPHPAISWKFFFWGENKDEAFGEFAKRVVEYLYQELSESSAENKSSDDLHG